MVLTAADVPVNEYGLTLFDQPVMVGRRAHRRVDVPCDVTRWEADHLAVVVAETAEAAETRRGRHRGRVGAAAGRGRHRRRPRPRRPARPPRERGRDQRLPLLPDPQGRRWTPAGPQAAVVVEGTYEVPHQEHAYLQPEAAVAYVDDEGRVTVEVAGQWTHEDQEQIAHALDLDLDRVRVIYPAIGGAFGGREDMSLQIVHGARRRRPAQEGETRPVAYGRGRARSRSSVTTNATGVGSDAWGADADGRIVAVESEAWLDAGAYNYTSNKVLGNLHIGQAGPYEVPNARIDSHAVYTNAVPGGAFRGFGGPQARVRRRDAR